MFENPRGHKTVPTLGYTLAQVGEYFGVSYATVSQAVKQAENRMGSVKCKACLRDLSPLIRYRKCSIYIEMWMTTSIKRIER